MLPSLIEIEPPARPAPAEITIPGSKSLTNRALVLAALARGTTRLRGALWSEDTEVMVDALRRLGFAVTVDADPDEEANRLLTVVGQGGRVPPGGRADAPRELFVGNAGTAARFLSALVCLGAGWYRLHGVPRMHERPQGALFAALRQLGYRVEAPGDLLPARIEGQPDRPPRSAAVGIDASSQFASALLLAAAAGNWRITVAGTADEDEAPYVAMTRQLAATFPADGGEYQVEPDASSASYFIGAGHLHAWRHLADGARPAVGIRNWPSTDWQVDARFPLYLPLPPEVSRRTDLGDAIMTAIVLAPLEGRPVAFHDLGRLRVQECERVAALRTELTRCGARVEEAGDSLLVHPSSLHGAEIETYQDHRMAMCFATLGLHVPGVKIRNPACVRKTFPNFFRKLTLPAPHGLGAVVREAGTGRRLSGDELLAG